MSFDQNKKTSIFGICILVGCAVLAVVVVTLLTEKPIQQTEKQLQQKTLQELIPYTVNHDDIKQLDSFTHKALREDGGETKLYLVSTQKGAPLWIFSPLVIRGYNGWITIDVSVNTTFTIERAVIRSHNETAGIGDKIDNQKSPWIESLILKHPNVGVTAQTDVWHTEPASSIDGITGATISSRAVIRALQKTLRFSSKNLRLGK